jgi:hypothetical protein
MQVVVHPPPRALARPGRQLVQQLIVDDLHG